MQLHWTVWQPTPYNDYLFQNLAREESLDLLVHYREKVLSSHPWRTSLAQGYSSRLYNTFLKVDWHLLMLAIKEKKSFFLVSGWDHPTAIILLIFLRLSKRSYALWTDTPSLEKKRNVIYARVRTRFLNWIFDGAKRVMGTGLPGIKSLQQMGVATDRVVNFPYFTDLSDYVKSPPHDGHRSLCFVSSGRIANLSKGHDIALKALAQASKRHEVLPFEYSIAGSGPDEAGIKLLAKQLDLEKSISLLGWLDPHDLHLMYRSADILIHPSPSHDPFPNSVLEGMAAGLVVLASDACGSAIDRIENGVNGFIHRAGDVDELEKQILFLMQYPECLSEMADNARATAEKWPVKRGIAIIKELVQVN